MARKKKIERITPAWGTPIEAYVTLFVDSNGRIDFLQPMIAQPREAMLEDIAQLLRSQLGLLKRDALPVADKILDVFEWYGYKTSPPPGDSGEKG